MRSPESMDDAFGKGGKISCGCILMLLSDPLNCDARHTAAYDMVDDLKPTPTKAVPTKAVH